MKWLGSAALLYAHVPSSDSQGEILHLGGDNSWMDLCLSVMEATEEPLAPLPYALRRQWPTGGVVHHHTWNLWSSITHGIRWCLDLGHPGLQKSEQQFQLFISSSIYGIDNCFCYSGPNKLSIYKRYYMAKLDSVCMNWYFRVRSTKQIISWGIQVHWIEASWIECLGFPLISCVEAWSPMAVSKGEVLSNGIRDLLKSLSRYPLTPSTLKTIPKTELAIYASEECLHGPYRPSILEFTRLLNLEKETLFLCFLVQDTLL